MLLVYRINVQFIFHPYHTSATHGIQIVVWINSKHIIVCYWCSILWYCIMIIMIHVPTISHICQYAPHRPTVVWITQLTFSLQNKSLPQIVLTDVLLFWDNFIKYYSANISNAPIIKTSEQISLKIYFYLVVGGWPRSG